MNRWARLLAGIALASLTVQAPAQEAATQAATAPAVVTDARRPAAIVPDQSTPKGAMKLYYLATRSGTGEELRSLMDARTPEQKEFVDARIALLQAERALSSAASTKFGHGMDRFLRLPATMPADAASYQVDYTLAELSEQVTGDQAVVGNGQQNVKLLKIDGKWQISLESERLERAAEFRRRAQVYTDVAAQILAGKYLSPPQIAEAIQSQLKPAATQPGAVP